MKFADIYSFFSQISSGGPLVSMFAVSLFSVYMNDLPDRLNNKIFLQANDTKITGEFSEHKELQFAINSAIEWSGSNKLNFKFDK